MIPKVLVISNECFSKMSSNGRTLGNFFIGWPKEYLAQFFLTGKPDSYFCNQFFQVSDRQALNALLRKKNKGGKILIDDLMGSDAGPKQSILKERKVKRNALTMLLRNFIWKTGVWKKSGYWQWVGNFQPDVVLLQAGDCAFMFDLAVKTVERMNAKLVIYNSEGYYYKDFDYFQGKGLAHMVYPIFQSQLRRSLEKAYEKASCVVYTCDELKKQYLQDFSGQAETVFTGSEIQHEEREKSNAVFTTVYCGNLGLKRHESLIEIAEILQSISEELYVDVYGKVPTAQIEEELNRCKGIRYHGLVSYEQVRILLRDSDLLLYVESFDPFYQEDIKFGFSTKIADSLSSGNCFLLYAPEHFVCYQYLKNNHAAYTVANKEELKLKLKTLVENPEARSFYMDAALKLADRNHRIEKNKERFQRILRDLVE